MASKNLNDLFEPLKEVAEKAIDIATKKGMMIGITCTLRSPEEQLALYAQGREPLSVVNAKRKALGLYQLTEDENKRKVTWIKKSLHTKNPSMAFDFVIKTSPTQVSWDLKVDVNKDSIPDYEEFAGICKSLDSHITWGGDWDSPDCPHIQWDLD